MRIKMFEGSVNLLQFVIDNWQLLFILTIVFSLYFHYTSSFDHFEKKGVKFLKPKLILGNWGARLLARKSFHEFQLYIYAHFKGVPCGGIFEGSRPVLYIIDPELIRVVGIRDFEHFMDRNSLITREPNYLKRSMLNLKGTEWKGVRSKLTPAFTSARLKIMIPLIKECSQQLVNVLKKADGQDVEMKDTIARYTLEVIGACAFGITSNSLTDDNAYFIKVAEKFNYVPKTKRLFILLILMIAPKLLSLLNISFLNIKACDELVRILKEAKEERKTSGIKKSDFLQLMIDESEKDDGNNYLDDDTMDGQSLLFLIGGFETASTWLSFAIHIMATRPNLQEKLRLHVEEVTHGKDVSYEHLNDLTYLEGFLLETLRMYPPASRVDRVCTKQFTIPDTSITVNVGDVIVIPIYGIHMDSDYYPDPKEFRPERFMGAEKKERPSHLFLPFGIGPRNCLGMRFAMISAKLVMVSLLKYIKFSTCPKTVDPIEFDKRAFLLKSKYGQWIHVQSLKI